MKRGILTARKHFSPQDFEAVLADPRQERMSKIPGSEGYDIASTSVVAEAAALRLQIWHPSCFSFVHRA